MKKAICLLLLSAMVLTASCNTNPAETTPVTETAAGDTAGETTQPEESRDYIAECEENKMFTELMNDLSAFPFTYDYAGTSYSGFSNGEFESVSKNTEATDNGAHTTVMLKHLKSGADFALDVYFYPDYSAYEFKVTVTNNGGQNTEQFANLFCTAQLDVSNAVLNGLSGDSGTWYAPYRTKLKEKATRKQSTGGRPTHGGFPYFDISGDDGGYLFALGWSGCWRADFSYVDGKVTLSGGQYNLDTYLCPGESVRSPLFAFVKYEEDATNAWRHYFINCVMRKVNGENVEPLLTTSKMSDGLTESKALTILKAYTNHGVKLDCFWLDAGWYTGASGETVSWPQTGTLNIDTSRYPSKFADISSYMHSIDGKFLLWFEPEVVRVDKDQFLTFCSDFKAEWYLGTAAGGSWLEGQLLDLGNPECVAWLTAKISAIIAEGGVDVYRQDFNVDPAPVWNSHNEKGREGIVENKYVVGYLSFWDRLIERFPNIIIDSCASGGGRNDLESMKRAVPLHYSDWFDGNNEDYSMKQNITGEIFAWFPYFKNEVYQPSLYKFRCNYAPMFIIKVPSPISKDVDWETVLKAQEEYNIVKEYFYDDYYMLLDYGKTENRYNGWMFYNAERGEGYAEILRNEGSRNAEVTVKLQGLDADTVYTLKDFDGLVELTAKGSELMSAGVKITTPEAPYAVIILIKAN